jgi:hypothetical protein
MQNPTENQTYRALLIDIHYFITANNGIIARSLKPEKWSKSIYSDHVSFPFLMFFVKLACHIAAEVPLRVVGSLFAL